MKYLNEGLKFIKESKKYIFRVSVLFILFVVIGFLFPVYEEQLLKIISELKLMFDGLNLWQTIGLIFFNNSRACLMAILFGITFGAIPILVAVFNGYLIGFVSKIVVNEGSFLELWKFLPHGVFELPAVLISLGFGMKIGIELLRNLGRKQFLYNINGSLKSFVVVIIPLLILAAIIEGLLIFCFS